ncbi:hypothetical protein [Methylophaga sp.]|uniref:hypothetical protein n=1 Tax=Methylophaga sp. TaxID=2024840 RepID=UPI00271F7447|nr:hypothetical protein [Methylophaga sp.]MDO8828086.1 hypothetical protein [Methylophaga sp.]
MLLDTYSSQGLLSITSVLGATSTSDLFAFRGDLILKEGEMRSGSEREQDRKPPEFLLHQAAILTDNDKLVFVNGLLYELGTLALFVDKFKADLTADTLVLLYIENISEKMVVEYQGFSFQLLPYVGGMVWNEMLEQLYVEKSDLKGQSAEDKVVVAYDAAKDFAIKADTLSFADALDKTFIVEKDLAVGPV